MAPKPWTTEEQRIWFEEKRPEFIRRQAEGKLYLFWAPMQEDWFRNWPEWRELCLPQPNVPGSRPLTAGELSRLGDAISDRKKKTGSVTTAKKSAMRNAPGGSSSAAAVATKRVFNLHVPRRQRAHQPIELFQKRNSEIIRVALCQEGYDKMNEAATRAEDVEGWEDESPEIAQQRIKLTKADRMRLRMRVVRALFDAASEQELEEIAAEIEQEKEQMRKDNEDAGKVQEAGLQAKTPQERQEAVDVLDSAYTELHKGTYAAAGWVGLSIVGGPNPRLGGELSYKVICFGQTPAGNDFEQACPDFDRNIEQTFESWLRAVFSQQQRAACALPVSAPPPSEQRLPRLHEPDVAVAPAGTKKPKRVAKKKSPAIDSQASNAMTVDPSVPSDPVALSAVNAQPSSNVDLPASSATQSYEMDLDGARDFDAVRSSDFDAHPATASNFDLHSLDVPQATVTDGFDVRSGSDLELQSDVFTHTQSFDPFSYDPTAFQYNASPYDDINNALKFDDDTSSSSGGGTTFDLPRLPAVDSTTRHDDEALDAPPSPTPTAPLPAASLGPRPAWKGAPAVAQTRSVGGFNFPVENGASRSGRYAPSILFQAFTRPPAPAPSVPNTPSRFGVGKPSGPLPTPPRFTRRTPGGSMRGGRTVAAQTLLQIIATPTAPVINATPANVAATSTPVVTCCYSVVTTPISISDPAAVASSPPTARAPTVFPTSRPPTKAPPPASAPAVAKSAASKKKAPVPGRVTAGAVRAAKAKAASVARDAAEAAEEDVEDAAEPPNRSRGRPRKIAPALAEATNVAAPKIAETPTLVYSITNNNAAFEKVAQGRRAATAAAKAAAKAAEKAAEVEAQAQRGWFSTPNVDGPTDTVTLRRARRAPTMADGSKMTRQVKGSRVKNPHAATEAALLARTAGVGKRKAAASENDGPKKKQYVSCIFSLVLESEMPYTDERGRRRF
ncbi:hypothetical protein C8R43DRAFT_1135630 [Mycena crocata]|nr:hypothetical protein C8R43DRAFT_1135630 [Mycena crocata]